MKDSSSPDPESPIQQRVRRMRLFYMNLLNFVWVNILLIVINLLTSPHDLWFYWVTIIWGAVLIFQAFNTFLFSPFMGDDWEQKKIKELQAKEEKKRNKKSGPK